MTPRRPVRAFGDGAVVVDTDSVEEAHGLAAAIDDGDRRGIEDVVVGYRSVTVIADPTTTDVAALGDALSLIPAAPDSRRPGERVEIPVAFDGPDLDDVAHLARIPPSRVVDLLTGGDLRVAFVGFTPGFAYLVGLPPDLASVPRRPSPRPAVPGGSVALAGGFAGIYPRTSPGGWQVMGRTAMRLFDPGTPPYAVLRPGDLVRLRAGDPESFPGGRPPGRRRPLRSEGDRTVLVEEPGFLSFVQDAGRLGLAGLGVPRAGAADPYAMRVANRLVGNDDDAAVIEATARGPALRFSAPAHAAVVGTAEVTVDGRSVPTATVVPVGAGQTMTIGVERRGLRSYVAVSGAIDIPTVLGSRSSDVLSGLGAGALVGGDVLGLGPTGRPRGTVRPVDVSGAPSALRVVVGPDPFPPAALPRLFGVTWEVGPSSDRIGVRLRAAVSLEVPTAGIDSRGMVTGAIQVPPDGQPIVLLCDHATVGGYPVVATVVTADLGVLGQLRPGDAVRFAPVDLLEAARARSERDQFLRHTVVGWYPVRTD
jgi:KipI family sensor histidine kinase inhibitor